MPPPRKPNRCDNTSLCFANGTNPSQSISPRLIEGIENAKAEATTTRLSVSGQKRKSLFGK